MIQSVTGCDALRKQQVAADTHVSIDDDVTAEPLQVLSSNNNKTKIKHT